MIDAIKIVKSESKSIQKQQQKKISGTARNNKISMIHLFSLSLRTVTKLWMAKSTPLELGMDY